MERKGFTLVELLIVIAIMGILSVSMMMAGSKGTMKAQVAKVATGISTIGNAVQLFISVSGLGFTSNTIPLTRTKPNL